MLLCKGKNKVVAEYALRNNTRPLGVAEYQLVASLPAELQTSLPTIDQIERELGKKKPANGWFAGSFSGGAMRRDYLGSSTLSITWITPLDW